jgi:hypothetical protein
MSAASAEFFIFWRLFVLYGLKLKLILGYVHR